MLQWIDVPSSIDEIPIPEAIRARLLRAEARIEAFQDRWEKTKIEQFVAADYELVYQALTWTLESQSVIGKRFLEWGCGFAVVSALASSLGLDAMGIESESVLLEQGRKTIANWNEPVELVAGNFLPSRAESLADDPTLPSLGHPDIDAYERLQADIDDFAIVYSYPWPGEDDFHSRVFQQNAAHGALQLMFCGPYDIRLCRKA